MKVYTKILIDGHEFITKAEEVGILSDADKTAETFYQHFTDAGVFKTILQDGTPLVMGKEAMSKAVFTFHNVEE